MKVPISRQRRNRQTGGPTFYTLLVLRHGRQRFRQLCVSRTFVVAAAALLLLVVGAGLAMPRLLLSVNAQSAKLEQLEQENFRLISGRDRIDEALAEMSDRLGQFELRAGRLARELGVTDRLAGDEMAGGPGPEMPGRAWHDDDIQALDTRGGRVDRSLQQLDAAFNERVQQLGATPSVMPVHGDWPDVWFSHGYGWRKDPFTGKRAFHRGIDIVAEPGVEVRATAAGVVSRVGRYPDYGRAVELTHGYGFETRYAHLSRILVSPGDRLERGEVIGLVGSTGRSTGPHLHYELTRDGRRVNPWKYLGQ